MKSKEKIIDGLEKCISEYVVCKECPYKLYEKCDYALMKDALELIQKLTHTETIPASWKESLMKKFVKGE